MPNESPWKCPHCGYENTPGAALCNLCGEMRPRPEPPPPPPPQTPPTQTWTPPPAQPGPGPAGAEQWAPPSKPPPGPAAGGQWAPPARSLGEGKMPPGVAFPPARADREPIGCETLVEFVALLPFSLLVLLIPGGLRSRGARTALRVLLAAMILLTIVGAVTIIPKVLNGLAGATNGLSSPDLNP